MNETEVSGLLDAHDALVAACVDGTLSLDEFVMAYGEFPGGYGLEDNAAAEYSRDLAAVQEAHRISSTGGERLVWVPSTC